MKGSQFHKSAVIVLLIAVPAIQASQYTEIKVDGNDGYSDVGYSGGVLTYSSDNLAGASNSLVLKEDTGTLPGDAAAIKVVVTSNFQDYNDSLTNPARALFEGGYVDLTFLYSPDGGTTVTSHQLKGPITQGSLEITACYDTYSTLTGVFQFDTNSAAGIENLPGSNDWPAPGVSTAVALTFAIGGNLTPFKNGDSAFWASTSLPTTRVKYDTNFSFFPEEQPIPEPASLILAALGTLFVLRRQG